MNEPISWDPSLVKKYNTSNHFKLLNQLRNEVKKYPLNNKKTSIKYQNKPINTVNSNNKSDDNSQLLNLSKDSLKSSPNNSNKSNVSFNNSKNFSIYNQNNNNTSSKQNPSHINDQSKSSDEANTQSFKERLDQIEMK